MNREFTYSWEQHSYTVLKLILKGFLDRSSDPLNNKLITDLKDQVETRSVGKVILIDVNALKFWDTEGIKSIIDYIVLPLVKKKNARIGFYGPKHVKGTTRLNQIYDDAKLKFEDIGTLIPWEESAETTLALLQKKS